jgi:hypothetical protein
MVVQVRYSVVGRLRDQVVPYAVCTVCMQTRSAGFLIEPQNQGRRFVSGLTSTTGTVLSSLTSKLVATVSWLSLKIKMVEGSPV